MLPPQPRYTPSDVGGMGQFVGPCPLRRPFRFDGFAVTDATAKPAILRFEDIGKQFAGVTALSQISFEIHPGRCHALMGENGAGKSTLGKIVAGIHQPTTGTVYLHGRPVRFNTTARRGPSGNRHGSPGTLLLSQPHRG